SNPYTCLYQKVRRNYDCICLMNHNGDIMGKRLLNQRVAAIMLAWVLSQSLTGTAGEPNTLTDEEKKSGWKLLFDGKTTAGWRGYQMKAMPEGWKALDGALVRVSGGKGGKGAGGGDDIVTIEAFENFDLQLEWKVRKNGNSGVLYHVSEEPIASWY